MNYKTRKERFVVIGGCAAGMSAASKAKRLNPNLEVLAFEKTAHVSYSACGIPYFISDIVRNASDLISITPEEFRSKRGIEVFTNHEVVDVKPAKRLVTVVNTLANKEFEYTYDKLLISVGGLPRTPERLKKSDFFTIQTLEDGVRIKEFIDRNRPASVLIVGGGYIAMEMAEACRQRGLEVSVVEKEQNILTG